MADQTAASLAATLLGLQRKRDPLEIYQSFGKQQMAAGSSTAPLGSGNALEGIARALQGGIGGLVQGYGMAREDQKSKDTVSALGDLYNAKTDAERADIIKNYKGDSDIIGPIAAQLLGGKQQREALTAGGNAIFGAPPDAATPPAGGPPVSFGAPLPQGAAPVAGNFANNSGNIRSTAPGNANGFATYDTPQQGANAHFANYQAYVKQNPNITVAQALAKWSPPNENNTGGIISQISEATGINPGMPLAEVLADPATAARLLDAQTRLEKGGLPQGFNADTFMAAAGGGAAPGVPGQVAQPPQMAQGGGNQPAQMQQGPVPPNVPPLPSMKPTPEETAEIRRQYDAGMFGQNPQEAGPKAIAALHAAVKDRVALEESRTKMGYDTQKGDYEVQRGQQLKQPQETLQNERGAREHFDNMQLVKDYRKADTVFRSAVKDWKTNTGAADLNLVYGFVTMLDPGSMVKEGETVMVRGTGSIADQARGMIAQLEGEGRLTPEMRANIMDQMASRHSALKDVHDQIGEGVRGIAQRGGMNPDNVVVPLGPVEWQRPPGLGKNARYGASPGEIVYGIDGKPVKR